MPPPQISRTPPSHRSVNEHSLPQLHPASARAASRGTTCAEVCITASFVSRRGRRPASARSAPCRSRAAPPSCARYRLDRDGLHVRRVERHHHVDLALGQRADRPRRRSAGRAAGRRSWGCRRAAGARAPGARLLAGAPGDLVGHLLPDAAEPHLAAGLAAAPACDHRRRPWACAPSATTTMEKCRPAASRARIFAHTFSMSKGISGMRMTSATPERPAFSAIHPA